MSAFLTAIHQWFTYLATTPVLPFYPITAFTALHSVRVAYLYHSVLDAQGVKVGTQSGQVSFLQAGIVCTALVMSGGTMAAILQGQAPSLLVDPNSGLLVSAYMLAAAGMTLAYPTLSRFPKDQLRIVCSLIDGFATTFGTITLGLEPVLRNPMYSFSSSSGSSSSSEEGPMAIPTILIPLLCGSGASLLVPIFGLLKSQFVFTHPGFLSGKIPVDLWGTTVITILYGTIVDGRGTIFGNLRNWLGFVGVGVKEGVQIDGAWMNAEEAHVLCSLVLSSLYIINEFGPSFFLGPLVPSSPIPPISTSPINTEKPDHEVAPSITAPNVRQSSIHTLIKRQQAASQRQA